MVTHPTTVNEYKPISLLNLSFKFMTKLLAKIDCNKLFYRSSTQINMAYQGQDYSGLLCLGFSVLAHMSKVKKTYCHPEIGLREDF